MELSGFWRLMSLSNILMLLSLVSAGHVQAQEIEKTGDSVIVWDSVPSDADMADDQPEPALLPAQAPRQANSDRLKKSTPQVQVTPKPMLEDIDAAAYDPSYDGYTEADPADPQLDRFLEATPPPSPVSKTVDIFLENKSQAQGFLGGYTNKRADIDLMLIKYAPSDIPLSARFQIANFGSYIRIGHEETGRLIGYSKNFWGFTSVYLEKDYYESRDFWSRFKIAPSGIQDWYLIRSYHDPKKCIAIGWRGTLRLKRCNINDEWQQWRFLREKSDAYWVPEAELLDLDII